MDRHFVTPSGTTVRLQTGELRRVPNRETKAIDFEVTSSGISQRGSVLFDAIPHMSALLQQNRGHAFTDETAAQLAPVAILNAVDEDPEMFREPETVLQYDIGPGNVEAFFARPRLSDRELRRYIARSVYDQYSRSDMDVLVVFDEHDHLVTGATNRDFLRNCQVLAAEGHLDIHRTMGDGFEVQPTAMLVRAVERYGSAKDDAIGEEDYLRTIQNTPFLAEWHDLILHEYRRYSTVGSGAELVSVFRATAPVVEGVLREVLRARGVDRDLATLGPMIGQMKGRAIGDRHLLSQLNHVLKFSRDLEQHGGALPEPVLRIATANAFELLPQIAALAP